MKWLLRGTLWVVALTGALGLFAGLVWFANDWTVSTLASLAVLGWLAAWLVIAYGRGRVRAAAMGAVVAGAAYWLLALGPWFQANIGSTLLTSRLLVWVEATHRQPAPPAGVYTINLNAVELTGLTGFVDSGTILTGSGTIRTTPQYVVTTIPQTPQQPPAMSAFQSAGHWSFAWLFALAGGLLAAVISRQRGDKTETQEAAA